MTRLAPPLLTVAALLIAPGVAGAQSLRCEGRLVGVGDTAFQLRALCGAPDHVAVQPVLRAEGVIDPQLGNDLIYTQQEVELWTYVGGAGDLTRLVTVERGLVTNIQTLPRVVRDSDPGCERGAPRAGATSGEVRLRCGAPVDISTWTEERVQRRPDGFERRWRVQRARWVYDLGPGRFLRILTFEGGRLLKVETGARSPE